MSPRVLCGHRDSNRLGRLFIGIDSKEEYLHITKSRLETLIHNKQGL